MKVTICVLALGFATAACTETAADTSTTMSTATTTTKVAPTTTLSTEEICLAFRDKFSPLIGQAGDRMSESEQMFFDTADGLVSMEEMADASLLAADEFHRIIQDTVALGEPPEVLAESVRLFIRSAERLEEAHELASRGARTNSVPLLDEAGAAISEGNTFLREATDALPAEC